MVKIFVYLDPRCMILFQTIGDILLDEVFPSFKFEEFYTVNVEDIMKRFKHGIEGNTTQDRRFSLLIQNGDTLQSPYNLDITHSCCGSHFF